MHSMEVKDKENEEDMRMSSVHDVIMMSYIVLEQSGYEVSTYGLAWL